MIRIIATVVIICCGLSAIAQTRVEKEEQGPVAATVILHADPRLALVTAYHEPSKTYTGGNGGSIHSGRGYRVMIYSGTDRNKANAAKADFMRRYPGIRVYMTYSLPQYRIKVGDYTSRQEATQFYRQLSSLYSPCMVVPDIVEINTFRKND
jgi:hypothetical protein